MRKVCRLAREVLDIAARAAKPGVTTDYIDEIVHKACMEREVRLCEQQQRQCTLMLCSRTLHPSITATSPSQYAHR
jgi:methionine aminopeptidase